MIRAAALIAGVALLASGCGGKPAGSVAEVAPADARAVLSIPPKEEQPLMRRALTFASPSFQSLIDRAQWARAAGRRVEVVQLAAGPLVAYVRLKDTKRLDAAGLVHARTRGWIVFAPTKAALDAARSKHHLAQSTWYPPGAEAAGHVGWTFVEPGWFAMSAEGGTLHTASPAHGADAPHPLAADVPADAVAVAASHQAAELLRALPAAVDLYSMLGLRVADLARATPGSAVLYVRPGLPIPSVTLLAQHGSLAAARRVVRELAPNGQPPMRESVNGLALDHVALGAVDLYDGRVGRTLVLTNDPQISFGGKHLEPDGLPDSTSEWFYIDVAHARPALAVLGLLTGKPSWTKAFDRRFSGLSSFLSYRTHDHGVERGTVVLR